MASWDDEKMARVDRKCVKDSVGEVGLDHTLAILELTERAFFRG
ncbi:hypothetical protein DAMNIGENAA_20630 [Desulforhabdus amnigena]|uniref:Uncharacterized protein n=1 Tax=Desulforhabdus amnigena TaxID=40218 RepID=A0A9W6D5N0_9BACT|nr:hypothetical protein DAMNIGENAA_20630 [Desulforhabdus amnigena]